MSKKAILIYVCDRQAQNLGLHLQRRISCGSEETLHSSLRDLWYDEHRRRLWVSLFAWDG